MLSSIGQREKYALDAGSGAVRTVERSALVPYAASRMFALVADVESYPQFLPACTNARIHERSDTEVVASIAFAQGPLRTEFRTRNRLVAGQSISMELVQGPFRELAGAWTFTPIGSDGYRVALRLRIEFDNRVADLLLGPAFEAICNSLVDAFVRRARVLYG
jgi:ribosome-associated toxin RatA of RatAB toxin-antitoxin module